MIKMARPTNKTSLLTQGKENYDKLINLIASLSPAEQLGEFPFEDRDRNLRDVLIHLYEWHQLYLAFVEANLTKEAVTPFLPTPYNWKTTAEMNVALQKKHQQTTLDEAKNLLADSHQKVLDLIETFSNEELFTKKYYNWTGTTSLGSYSVSATSSHYDWAMKKIRQYKRGLK